MNIVLFLGAGASRAAPLCLPTTNQFFGKPLISDKSGGCLPNLGAESRFQKLSSKSQALLGEIARYYRTDLESLDIEKVLSITGYTNLLEATKEGIFVIRDIVKEKRDRYALLDKEVKRMIFEVYAGINRDQSRSLYGILLSNLGVSTGKTSSLDIFTTNYDRAIERIFPRGETSGIRPQPTRLCDGFVESPKGRGLRWSKLGYYPSGKEYPEGFWNINLYKLHGSVGWVKVNGEVESIDYEKVVRELQDHVVIYPGFKGVPLESIFAFPHQKLKEALMKADLCFVIGFSFRDEYITRIFEEVIDERIKAWSSSPERPLALSLYWCDPAESYPKGTGIKKLADRFGGNGLWIYHLKGRFGDQKDNIWGRITTNIQGKESEIRKRAYLRSKRKQ